LQRGANFRRGKFDLRNSARIKQARFLRGQRKGCEQQNEKTYLAERRFHFEGVAKRVCVVPQTALER
jgi:hypothetical protein